MLLLMAACDGNDPAPNLSSAPAGSGSVSSGMPSQSVSASPSPSATYPADVPLTGHNVKPGEKPPVYPAAAAARTQAGANAFAEFFMKTLDWAYATTNPSYMKHYYGPTCGLCNGIATGISKTAAAKHAYEGGRFTVHIALPSPIAPVKAPADKCSWVSVDISAETVVDKDNRVLNGDGAYKGLRFKLCARFTETWQTTYLAHT